MVRVVTSELDLPDGVYRITFIDPSTGQSVCVGTMEVESTNKGKLGIFDLSVGYLEVPLSGYESDWDNKENEGN